METLKAYIPKNWKQLAIYGAIVAIVAILTAFGLIGPGDIVIPDPPTPVFQPSEVQANGGWHKDDEAVKAIQDTLAFRVFADTPAGKSDDPLPESVYLWQSYAKLFGRGPPSKNQLDVGSCVSFGTNNAIERTLATQIVLAKGSKEEFKHIVEEVTYGGSRVEIGGGRIRGDGSVGAWAAQFVQKWGIVARDKYGALDLTVYSTATCRKFGQSGVPPEIEQVARERPVKDITLVKTWDSAKKALASGYGIAICSGQGFAMQRDANGIARASGSWAHCMCLDGYTTINGKEYGHIENSWGDKSHTGPVGPGDPPSSGFWADATVIARMLGEGDSWAFSAVRGWPGRAKELDWFVQVAPRQNEIRFASLQPAREVQYSTLP